MSELVIEIPMLPPAECSPNARGHPLVKAGAVKAWRRAAYYAAVEVRRDYLPPGSYEYDIEVAWSGRRQAMDDDNLLASCKAARDGLADALFEDREDRRLRIGRVTQVRGAGTTTFTIRAVPPA